MFGRVVGEQRAGRPLLAWIGLFLMVAAFVWLQLLSPPSRPQAEVEAPAAEGPFAVVVLDPGHGGRDSGTMKAGLLEKELTLDVAQRAQRLLQVQGFVTVLTRTGDAHVSLAERAAVANAQSNCVFVSIHFDDATRPAATGVETYFAARQISKVKPALAWLPFLQQTAADTANAESQSLADRIQEALVAHTQAVNRGTASQQFFVIANVRHPAVLVEGGFLTNTDELNKLATAEYREQIAAAITAGVKGYRDALREQETPVAANLSGTNQR